MKRKHIKYSKQNKTHVFWLYLVSKKLVWLDTSTLCTAEVPNNRAIKHLLSGWNIFSVFSSFYFERMTRSSHTGLWNLKAPTLTLRLSFTTVISEKVQPEMNSWLNQAHTLVHLCCGSSCKYIWLFLMCGQ